MLEGFYLITENQFNDIVDNGGDHPVFAWMTEQGSDNDVFMDGALDGYRDHYNIVRDRPAPVSAHNLYMFFKGVFMASASQGAATDPTFLDSYEMGWCFGWSVALGEMNRNLFFVDKNPHSRKSGWFRLRDEHGVDVVNREAYPTQHCIQYGVSDANGLYVATVAGDGITCTCGQAECAHVKMVARISSWFNDAMIIQPEAVATGN